MTLPWKKGQIKYVPVMYPLFKSLYGLSREEGSIFLQFYIISSETKTKELFSQNANKVSVVNVEKYILQKLQWVQLLPHETDYKSSM